MEPDQSTQDDTSAIQETAMEIESSNETPLMKSLRLRNEINNIYLQNTPKYVRFGTIQQPEKIHPTIGSSQIVEAKMRDYIMTLLNKIMAPSVATNAYVYLSQHKLLDEFYKYGNVFLADYPQLQNITESDFQRLWKLFSDKKLKDLPPTLGLTPGLLSPAGAAPSQIIDGKRFYQMEQLTPGDLAEPEGEGEPIPLVERIPAALLSLLQKVTPTGANLVNIVISIIDLGINLTAYIPYIGRYLSLTIRGLKYYKIAKIIAKLVDFAITVSSTLQLASLGGILLYLLGELVNAGVSIAGIAKELSKDALFKLIQLIAYAVFRIFSSLIPAPLMSILNLTPWQLTSDGILGTIVSMIPSAERGNLLAGQFAHIMFMASLIFYLYSLHSGIQTEQAIRRGEGVAGVNLPADVVGELAAPLPEALPEVQPPEEEEKTPRVRREVEEKEPPGSALPQVAQSMGSRVLASRSPGSIGAESPSFVAPRQGSAQQELYSPEAIRLVRRLSDEESALPEFGQKIRITRRLSDEEKKIDSRDLHRIREARHSLLSGIVSSMSPDQLDYMTDVIRGPQGFPEIPSIETLRDMLVNLNAIFRRTKLAHQLSETIRYIRDESRKAHSLYTALLNKLRQTSTPLVDVTSKIGEGGYSSDSQLKDMAILNALILLNYTVNGTELTEAQIVLLEREIDKDPRVVLRRLTGESTALKGLAKIKNMGALLPISALKDQAGTGMSSNRQASKIRLGVMNLILNDLYKGYLTVKYDSGRAYSRLNKIRISPKLVELIDILVNKHQINREIYEQLDDRETRLFDELMRVSKMGVEEFRKYAALKKMKQGPEFELEQFEKIKAEILAGNNNPDLVRQLKTIVIKLVSEDAIPKAIANKLMYQITLLT